ncbi:helicase and polymerase-containing protein TEBICHI isoform X2 [Vitis vinifera]|uniref:helicase and polymerase-containing protein TEBICHI isoform X2 n=1 Tax=Vitis vinifera TaxID=29760 RepID=UPI00053FFD61|nr:helicase and polymerase-containing protein TEBICHI isoform X2 [Vitis vinifera]|eukprot:XP_010648535.1 PREDICTED: helicase and polymerase-containing protein TEBICHI isoform X2 [Vitis vinifera]
MASDSIRNRIDQFFSSKKRKPLSPGLKTGRIEKDSKRAVDGSPSSKGTLDNYLVTYPDDNSTARGSSAGKGPVKRNLTLEINLPSKDENENALLSGQLGHGTTEAFGETHTENSRGLSQMGGVGVGEQLKDCSVSAHGPVNSELKQIAADFLSLYCSEFPSSASLPSGLKVNVNKRCGSPSLQDVKNEISKKRHCIANADQSRLEGEDSCLNENNYEDGQLGLIVKPVERIFDSSREVTVGNDATEVQGSLRKSNERLKSTVNMTECYTPGPLTVNAFAHETPNSMRGSSMFSPGESFWNEAIQVADGLFAPKTDEQINAAKSEYEMKNSCNLRNAGCGFKLKEMLVDGDCTVEGMEIGVSSGSLGYRVKDSDQVSPLPVKRFDFLFEEKNLDETNPPHCSADKLDVMDGEQSACGSVNHKVLKTTGIVIDYCKAQTNGGMSEVKDMNSIDAEAKREVDLLSQEKDNIKADSPDLGITKSIIACECDEASTPSSFEPLKDSLDLSKWLPSEICNIYRKKGISKLYSWQVDCLKVDGVLQKRNLVYCASTSAGKSFVAEILMLRRLISTGKMALLVLPYVSICAEKAEHLEVLLEPLGKHVRSYYGNQGGGTLPKDTSVAVCTIEKANSLINRLLEEGRLSEIGIIVIDELHMVGDQNRGYLLELLLTKLRYAAGEGHVESVSGESSNMSSGKSDPAHGLQIVGMSATMPNVAAVADWLQAALYQTDFRPVPLEEYIKVGNTIYDKKMDIIRTISKTADLGGKDPDHIVELCNEVVQEGHSVLLFCSSRKGCEFTARHVSKFLKKFSTNAHNNTGEFVDISSAIDALRRSPAGLDPILEETLPSGVAYHHAGLTVEERDIVETCYRKGLLRVLTATSTLAAGVNLPARRVIFRQPRIGRDFIDGTRYKQMAGRAGRTGIDTKGESVLICKPEEVKRICGLLNESCPPLYSCLSEDKNGMTHAILEVVASGIVQTANDINRYVRCTLLNSTKPFQDVVKSAQDSLRWLCHRKFLEWNEDTKLYSTTPLGRAAFGSSLCPEESLVVLDDLSRAREGFVLASDLHLVYLVTPINVDVEPDWELFYERFMQLSALDQEVPVTEVCEAFKVARGMVQGLQENAGRFASMVSLFCERLGWNDLEGLVAKFQNRVSFGVRAEIVELTTIPYVKGSRARALYKAGLRTPLAIAEASIPEIVKALFEFSSWAAEGNSVQRNVQLGVAKKIKNAARKIVLDKAEEARIAAFSAFKSLGLNVPQFSRPLLLIANDNPSQEAASTSSGEGATSSFVGTECMKSGKPAVEGSENSNKVASEIGVEKLKNMSDVILGTAGEVKSTGPIQCKFGAENPAVLSILNDELNSIVDRNENAVMPLSIKSMNTGNGNGTSDAYVDHGQHEQQRGENECLDNNGKAYEKGPIHATNTPGGFDSFLDLWDSVREFYFDIHFNKQSEVNSLAPYEIHGIAICWENSPVYYINLPKDLLCSDERKNIYLTMNVSDDKPNILDANHRLEAAKWRWSKVGKIMGKKDVRKFTWNLKVQIQVLKNPAVSIQKFGSLNLAMRTMGLELIDNSYLMLSPVYIVDGLDMCIVTWILWPDEERSSNPNLEKEVRKRLSSEAAAAANRSGRWKNQTRRAAHNGCCRRVAQTRALCSVLWKLLVSEELVEVLLRIEIPLVTILADMEVWGIGVDMEGCIQARNVLGKKLRHLEKEAYELAGMTFSLYTAADIANVLYGHLKLPIPEGHNKGKQHPSTDKHCLDLLRHEHPIIPVIKEHRTLAKLLNCTLGSICSLARLSLQTQRYTLHGHWLQTSTATGRLSMEEPNLQCVEHVVEFKMIKGNKDVCNSEADHYKINARDFFVPSQENWLLLTADYSQIELRLMAHFSRDSSLTELLSKPHGDVFTMIAAKWTGKPESVVGYQEREQTKRLVYGILYGMGANTLAKQLECSLGEAEEKIRSFRSSFPGVASWLHEAVACCCKKGYVKTLKGRKRFLSKIKFGTSKEKLKARRQAVNSICQGSAADIIKIAMINIHSVIAEGVDEPNSSTELPAKFHMLKGRCRIILQVHDELVLEVDPSVMKEAGLLLKMTMENSTSLLVPLLVKLKVGRTWGSLEPFHAEPLGDEMLVLQKDV